MACHCAAAELAVGALADAVHEEEGRLLVVIVGFEDASEERLGHVCAAESHCEAGAALEAHFTACVRQLGVVHAPVLDRRVRSAVERFGDDRREVHRRLGVRASSIQPHVSPLLYGDNVPKPIVVYVNQLDAHGGLVGVTECRASNRFHVGEIDYDLVGPSR